MAYYVNVYLVDRAYGGSEEGGWWYDCGEAVSKRVRHDEEGREVLTADAERARFWERVFTNEDEAIEYMRAVQARYDVSENAHRRSDISSVNSEGKYWVMVEDGPAASYPTHRPHYE